MDFKCVNQNNNFSINVNKKLRLNLLISLKKFMKKFVLKLDIGYIHETFQKVKCRNEIYQ